MKILKWLGICIIVLVVAFGAAYFGLQFHDGPYGLMAGGPFNSGQVVRGAEPNWRFVKDEDTVEFQSLEPPRSRTTWIVEYNNRIFIPCGYMNSTLGKLWKQWPLEAEKDGRAILRIKDRLYERSLVRHVNGAFMEPVLGELNRKYKAGAKAADVASGSLWIFELQPRS